MTKANIKFEGSTIIAGFDANEDGENSIDLELFLKEVYEEIAEKGEAKIDVKTLNFKMVGTKLQMSVDTDRDGEPVLNLNVHVGEVFEEVAGAVTKSE